MGQMRITRLMFALFLAGCKFVPTVSKEGGETAAKSDPQMQVEEIWASKVLPYLDKKAGPYPEVRTAAAQSAEAAGKRYGYKEEGAGSPWTVIVRIDGKIVAANTESRAGTMDVDADGDGKADARIQIGPVMRGTAIRDSLDFVSFNQFTNQIDFAQFGKAFNLYVDKTVTSKLPRDGLVGKSAEILGAYPLGPSGDVPLVTPVEIELKAP
jgi:predicted lipoprotein